MTQVRYGWTDFVQCVMMNQDGLPMGPWWHNFTAAEETKRLLQHSTAAVERRVRQNTPITRPPMGFNSWNAYHCNIDENVVRASAQAMIDNGMHAAGYDYVSKWRRCSLCIAGLSGFKPL